MARAWIRFWFCIAAAVIAAAVADPLVEGLSNAGFFGPGNFTDHSNLDVLPGIIAGVLLLGISLTLRVRRELGRAAGEALRANGMRLLPVILPLQIGVLFTMETTEQLVVSGHTLGGTVWLGGPVWLSLAVHAVTGVLFSALLARLACLCTRTTLRVIRELRALAMRALYEPAPLALRRRDASTVRPLAPVLCRIGNRAPPAFA